MTAILSALALLQGSSIRTAYARPLPLLNAPAHRLHAPRLPVRALPAWSVLPPGAADAMVPPGRGLVSVPILMYHYIRPQPSYGSDPIGWGLSTPPGDFRQQMDFLDRNGFHPVTLTDLRAYLKDDRALPDRPVVLTFDDGYEDFYTQAFPVLKLHHFKAVSYVVGGFIGRGGNLSADQIRELDANGIEIGAHTMTHADLTQVDVATLLWEVKGSRSTIEAVVGHPVLDFCYPSGRYNAQVEAVVQSAGFESATVTIPGATHRWMDRFTWTRVRVSGGESLADFAQGLAAHEDGMPPASVTPITIPRVYPLVYRDPVPGLQ